MVELNFGNIWFISYNLLYEYVLFLRAYDNVKMILVYFFKLNMYLFFVFLEIKEGIV